HVFFADHQRVAGTVADGGDIRSRVPSLHDTRGRRTGNLSGGRGVGLSGGVFDQGLDQDAVGADDKVGVGVAIAGRVVAEGSGHVDAARGAGKRNLRDVIVEADAAGAPAAGTVKDGQL